MKDIYIVQIEWIPYLQGGRKTLPSDRYAPIIVTEGNVLDTQKDCWSVILSDIKIIDTLKTVSKIEYLSEVAPKDLFPGRKFKLYEGSKLVADGIVLEKIVEKENL